MGNDYANTGQSSTGARSNGDLLARLARRTFLRGALASPLTAGLAAAAGGAPGGQQGTDDWPTFQHDAANTGAIQAAPPPTGITERWHEESIATDRSSVDLPAVAGGTVYLLHLTDPVDPRETKILQAYDAADGSERWAAPFAPDDDALGRPPTVADDRVFVVGSSLYAVDAATGTERWRLDLDGDLTAPTLAGDTLVLAAGDTAYGIAPDDGSVRWARPLGRLVQSTAAPPVAGGRVYVAAGETIQALDVADGSRQWTSATGPVRSSITVAGETVLAISDAPEDDAWLVVRALDAADGSERWAIEVPPNGGWYNVSGLSASAGQVYFLLGGMIGGAEDWPFGLYAFDVRSGDRQWVTDEIYFGEHQPTTPVVVGDVVFAGDELGALWAVDAGTGEVRWETEYGGGARTHPVATETRLFVTGTPNDAQDPDQGNLYAFEFERARAERTVEIAKGGQPTGVATYVLAVEGSISPGADFEDVACPDRDPAYVTGRVGPERGTDSVTFAGEIAFLDVFGPAELYLDGERTRPGAVAPGLPNTLRVTKEGAPDGRAEFEVRVDGVLAPAPDVESTVARTGCGVLREFLGPVRGTDSVHYSGRITEFALDGPATVSRNGKEVDPEDLG